jgi:hypothetical protein
MGAGHGAYLARTKIRGRVWFSVTAPEASAALACGDWRPRPTSRSHVWTYLRA